MKDGPRRSAIPAGWRQFLPGFTSAFQQESREATLQTIGNARDGRMMVGRQRGRSGCLERLQTVLWKSQRP